MTRPLSPTPFDARWEALQGKLLANASLLRRQGTLSSRLAGKKRVWSVRFVDSLPDGQRTQRSIYVGADPEILRRVQHVLRQLRTLAAWEDEAEKSKRTIDGLTALVRRIRPSRELAGEP